MREPRSDSEAPLSHAGRPERNHPIFAFVRDAPKIASAPAPAAAPAGEGRSGLFNVRLTQIFVTPNCLRLSYAREYHAVQREETALQRGVSRFQGSAPQSRRLSPNTVQHTALAWHAVKAVLAKFSLQPFLLTEFAPLFAPGEVWKGAL